MCAWKEQPRSLWNLCFHIIIPKPFLSIALNSFQLQLFWIICFDYRLRSQQPCSLVWSRRICCLLAIKFSTSVSSGKLSAPQRNLRNNFSGFIGKSASFPCLWNPFPGFGRNPRQQKMRKSISAKMWWLGLHYLLVAWNLRQGTIEQIEFVEKFLASMDTGQPQSLTVT